MASKGTPATALLTTQKVAHTLHPYDVHAGPPNYGAVVAEALGVDPAQVFKTLVAEVDGAADRGASCRSPATSTSRRSPRRRRQARRPGRAGGRGAGHAGT